MDKLKTNNFRVLSWYGLSNGTDLVPEFDISEIKNRKLTIKRIAFLVYSSNALKTEYWEETATPLVYQKTIPPASRITNVQGIEIFGEGLKPQLKINDIRIGLFTNTLHGYPIDLDMDNINVKFSEPVNSISISTEYLIYTDPPSDANTEEAHVKVVMEVYLD